MIAWEENVLEKHECRNCGKTLSQTDRRIKYLHRNYCIYCRYMKIKKTVEELQALKDNLEGRYSSYIMKNRLEEKKDEKNN